MGVGLKLMFVGLKFKCCCELHVAVGPLSRTAGKLDAEVVQVRLKLPLPARSDRSVQSCELYFDQPLPALPPVLDPGQSADHSAVQSA